MSASDIALILTAITGIGGGFVGFLTWNSQRKVASAEAAESLVSQALDLSKDYKARIDSLEFQVEDLENRLKRAKDELAAMSDRLDEVERLNDEYKHGIGVLTRQLRGEGLEPNYRVGK